MGFWRVTVALEWGECPWGCFWDFVVGGGRSCMGVFCRPGCTLEFIKAYKYYQWDSESNYVKHSVPLPGKCFKVYASWFVEEAKIWEDATRSRSCASATAASKSMCMCTMKMRLIKVFKGGKEQHRDNIPLGDSNLKQEISLVPSMHSSRLAVSHAEEMQKLSQRETSQLQYEKINKNWERKLL